MKNTAHTLISTVTGLGLATFTALSFVAAGIAAPATVLGFSFLAIYGLCEMAFIDYTPVRLARVGAGSRERSPASSSVRHAIVPAIVEFQRTSSVRRVA